MKLIYFFLILLSFSLKADNTAYITCLQYESPSECIDLKTDSPDSYLSNPVDEESDSWIDRNKIRPGNTTLDRLKDQTQKDDEANIDYEKKYNLMKEKISQTTIYPNFYDINGRMDSLNQFATNMSTFNSDILGCLANIKRSSKSVKNVKQRSDINYEMDYSFGEDTVNFLSKITLNAINKDYDEISTSRLGNGGRKKLSPLFQPSLLTFFQEYQMPFFNESYYFYEQDQNRCSFWLDPEINQNDPNVRIEKLAVSDDDKEAKKCYHYISSRRVVPEELDEIKKIDQSKEKINFEIIGLKADQEYIWTLERRICNGVVIKEFEKQSLYIVDKCDSCESGQTGYIPNSPLN
ncbi:MAG: hypothetical protein H6622_12205 [Halobacteriovoraceae bacterium]|nr:hypothetical protein [Halobacteriovoraceae bacterium]